MGTPEPPEGVVQLPVIWVGTENLPVHFINQFVGVVQPGEIHLTLGSLAPPAVIGATEEDRRAQLEALQFVQVKPVLRMALTPQRLREFIQVLQTTLQNYEQLPRS